MTRQDQSTGLSAPPETLEELEEYVPYLVNRLARLGQAAQNRSLSARGINNVTLRALSVLHIHGRLTVNEIATLAFTEQSTASRAIDAMVDAGLVEREISANDLRRRDVALTGTGSERLRECWPLMEQHYALMTEGIDAEEIRTCRRVLSRMTDNLRRGD